MPGFLLHAGATLTCFHAGQALPLLQNPRVSMMGMPSVTMAATYSVAACTLPTLTPGALPCASATWVSAATRITSNGQPLLLFDSQASCIPTATPLLVVATQTRVSGM